MKNLFLISLCLFIFSSCGTDELYNEINEQQVESRAANEVVFTWSYVVWENGLLDYALSARCDQPLDAPIRIPYRVSFRNSYGGWFGTTTYYLTIPAGGTMLSLDGMISDEQMIFRLKNENYPLYENVVFREVEVELLPYQYSGRMNIVGLDY